MADFRLGRLKFNWRGDWQASTAYVIDDIVAFKGNTYVCVVNHTSASDETQWDSTDYSIATPRWQLHVPGTRMMGAWTANTFYAVNDLVSFGANQYLCVANHTSPASEEQFYSSQTNWTLYVSSVDYKGAWSNGVYYKINDIVRYGNSLYLCDTAHTSGISFDETKFQLYLESLKFEDTWSNAVEYQPGDIVNFGGYTYVAKTIHTNLQPNANTSAWDILTTGFDVKGEYDNATEYVPGDVVQFGGNTYVKIVTGNAGVYPTDTSAWEVVSTGLNWRGPWNSGNTYQVNDVVSSTSASWVCLTAHNINIDPVADQTNTGGTNWQALAQGESTLTLQNPGDILFRNNGGANVNLAIGSEGDILTVDDAGLPAWERNNWCANVYYVAVDGTDDPDFGKNISKPWGSLRYALAQIPANASYLQTTGATYDAATGELVITSASHGLVSGDRIRIVDDALTFTCSQDSNATPHTYPRSTDPASNKYLSVTVNDANTISVNVGASPSGQQYTHSFVSAANNSLQVLPDITTIFVKSGTYLEQLPLVVPPYVSIVGDNLRATVIKPDPSTQSTDASPVENRFSTMFYLNESVTLKDLVMVGMEGFTPAVGANNAWDITQATVRGVFLRLDPSLPIIGKSPYITQCSAFSGRPGSGDANSGGGVGCIIDKSIYGSTTSNGSMLFDSFTQFQDGGVGFWCKDLGNAEIVSSFTYYAHIGYTCTGGGRIRSVAGNNSYGEYGCVSSGTDPTETALTGTVRGQRLNFTYEENSVLFKKLEQVVQGEDDGAGNIDYSTSNANYALALILYVQDEYLIIEPITGTFGNGLPIQGVSSGTVVGSGAEGTTDAAAALAGISGKIFTMDNLPVSGGQAVLPKPNSSTNFINVAGSSQYDDPGFFVVAEVVDPSTAQNLSLDTLRRYDTPGAAPTGVDIQSIAYSSDTVTVVTSSSHGLTSGDEVIVVLANPIYQAYGSGAFERETVTLIDGTTFSYSQPGLADISPAVNQGGSKVYLQSSSGGSTKAIHTGGTDVDLYNVSSTTTRLDRAGTQALDTTTTDITFQDTSILSGMSAGATNFILIGNELCEIGAINAGLGVTVTRGSEGTTAAEHADGSVVYYVTKTAAATTLKGDIDTAVTTLPIFSISNFDANDVIKIENEFLRVTAVNSALVGQATVTFSQPKTIAAASGQSFEMRLNYSQVRLTSHDFLLVGTGTKTTTNWPDQPLQDPNQLNEVYEDYPGRVYYVSTDQDGNFRVGEFFKVEQATGSATLDANAFDLSGLASLRLGTIGAQLGASINEFSTDVTLGGDFSRDTACPTQLAVKTYVDSQTGSSIGRTAQLVGVSALESTGTTATVTSFVPNNVYQGDEVIIAGADQANYNGTFIVASIDTANNQFTYTMPGTAVSPATGAITCERKQKIATDLDVVGNTKARPTWNDSATVFNAVDIDVTDTNSQVTSALIKADVGGSTKFAVDKAGNITAAGNLTVAGTTTTVNSTNLEITDKEIIIGSGSGDAAAADGAGLVVGTSGKSFKYDNGNTRWNLSDAINVGGNGLQIGGVQVLSQSTLGSGVTNSSLTSVGELTGLEVSGISGLAGVKERVNVRTSGESGNVNYDFAANAVYYHPSLAGDITINLANVPTASGVPRAFTIAVVVSQSGSPYKIANSFGINGSSYTIKWANASQPSGNASRHDIWNLSMIYDGSSWNVYSSASSFG